MRSVRAVAGVMFIVIGTTVVITGEAVVHSAWFFAGALAVLGLTGLVAASTGMAR